MDRKKTVLSVLGFVMCVLLLRTAGELPAGLAVYEEVGGAPALLQSPKSAGWMLRKHDQSTTGGRWQSAEHQGRRNYSEDRTFCTLDIYVPFPGPNGVIDTSVGIVAVFDGHNGAEASEKASELLLEYFTVHATILLDATYSFLSKVSMGMLGNWVEDGLDEKQGEHVLYIGRVWQPLATQHDTTLTLC